MPAISISTSSWLETPGFTIPAAENNRKESHFFPPRYNKLSIISYRSRGSAKLCSFARKRNFRRSRRRISISRTSFKFDVAVAFSITLDTSLAESRNDSMEEIVIALVIITTEINQNLSSRWSTDRAKFYSNSGERIKATYSDSFPQRWTLFSLVIQIFIPIQRATNLQLFVFYSLLKNLYPEIDSFVPSNLESSHSAIQIIFVSSREHYESFSGEFVFATYSR